MTTRALTLLVLIAISTAATPVTAQRWKTVHRLVGELEDHQSKLKGPRADDASVVKGIRDRCHGIDGASSVWSSPSLRDDENKRFLRDVQAFRELNKDLWGDVTEWDEEIRDGQDTLDERNKVAAGISKLGQTWRKLRGDLESRRDFLERGLKTREGAWKQCQQNLHRLKGIERSWADKLAAATKAYDGASESLSKAAQRRHDAAKEEDAAFEAWQDKADRFDPATEELANRWWQHYERLGEAKKRFDAALEQSRSAGNRVFECSAEHGEADGDLRTYYGDSSRKETTRQYWVARYALEEFKAFLR